MTPKRLQMLRVDITLITDVQFGIQSKYRPLNNVILDVNR